MYELTGKIMNSKTGEKETITVKDFIQFGPLGLVEAVTESGQWLSLMVLQDGTILDVIELEGPEPLDPDTVYCHVIYYEDDVKIVHVKGEPKEEDYPGSKFAEGPFPDEDAARARIRMVQGQY